MALNNPFLTLSGKIDRLRAGVHWLKTKKRAQLVIAKRLIYGFK